MQPTPFSFVISLPRFNSVSVINSNSLIAQPSKFLAYLDANNFYGWATVLHQTKNVPTILQNVSGDGIASISPKKKEWLSFYQPTSHLLPSTVIIKIVEDDKIERIARSSVQIMILTLVFCCFES